MWTDYCSVISVWADTWWNCINNVTGGSVFYPLKKTGMRTSVLSTLYFVWCVRHTNKHRWQSKECSWQSPEGHTPWSFFVHCQSSWGHALRTLNIIKPSKAKLESLTPAEMQALRMRGHTLRSKTNGFHSPVSYRKTNYSVKAKQGIFLYFSPPLSVCYLSSRPKKKNKKIQQWILLQT